LETEIDLFNLSALLAGNQCVGLGQMFFNSLRLTWQMSLWTDSAVLLRTMVWLDTPPETALLAGLQARQLELELPAEK
jgi:hypothetical protein